MGMKRTTREAADRLGLKPNTLEVWRVQGRGPRFIKIEGAVRYDDDDLAAYEEENRFNSTSEYTGVPHNGR